MLVVDCAPTAETLRLLALPEALGWYIDRVLPMERRVVKALKPVLTRAAGVPMPEDSVFDAIERLHAELDDVRVLLTGPDTSVRLVLTPESVVLAEARRAYTYLSLFGYRVDAAIVNRVFPDGGADEWRCGVGRIAQQRILDDAADSFAGLEVWTSVYRAASRSGARSSLDLAREMYDDSDPLATGAARHRCRSATTRPGLVLSLPLPLATQDDVRLVQEGRRARHLRRVVSSPPDAPVRAGAASRGRRPGACAGSCRSGSTDSRTDGQQGDDVSDAGDAHP